MNAVSPNAARARAAAPIAMPAFAPVLNPVELFESAAWSIVAPV